MEFAKFWADKPKVGQYTWIKMRYGLLSVNIKPQKYYLNMNPVCFVCLCRLKVFSASSVSIFEDMNIISRTLRVTL